VRKILEERLNDIGAGARADEDEAGIRDLRCSDPPGVGQTVDVLVRLQDADEERDRPVG